MHVDRRGPMPVTHQIEELIRGRITRGELLPGHQLPTEMELCKQLNVSRTPIRRALSELTAQGLLVRFPGRGTFVSEAPASAEAREPEELTIMMPSERWCWPLQKAATIWNEQNPLRPMRLQFQIVGQGNLRDQLALSVAQGTATDLTLVDSAWSAEFADRGYLQALDAIDAPLAAAITADLIHPLKAENSLHGRIYGLPAEADVVVLWYRRDWFAAENLSPPDTWEDWLRCGRHFQSVITREKYGTGLFPLSFAGGTPARETTTFQLLPVLWSGGADVISHNQVVLNSKEAESSVAFVADLVRSNRIASSDVVDSPWNGPALALASGRVAMSLGGSYERGLIQAAAGWDEKEFEERVAFVPIPAGPAGRRATLLGGMSYAISRQSRKQRLALELLTLVAREDVMQEFCARTHQNPPTISANRSLRVGENTFLQATARLIDHARARWPLPEYARVSGQIAHMFESAITGELTPSEAVARAAMIISGITGLPEAKQPGKRLNSRAHHAVPH